MALTVSGCAQTQTNTTPTATRTPAQALVWQTLQSPTDYDAKDPKQSAVSIVRNDGSAAYACTMPASGLDPRVFVTTDRGASWYKAAPLPNAASMKFCQVRADDTDAQIAFADVSAQPAFDSVFHYATIDGGDTWHALPAGLTVEQSSTFDGGMLAVIDAPSYYQHPRLVFLNQLSWTWRLLDQAIADRGEAVTTFRQSIWTGALIVGAANQQGVHLWNAQWNGANVLHWTQTQAPAYTSWALEPRAENPMAPQKWAICIAQQLSGPGVPGIDCSSDGGATWNTAVPLPAAATNTSILGVTRDGDLLCLGGSDTLRTVYRLSPGASAWQALGRLPQTFAVYAIEPAYNSDEQIWSIPLNNEIADGTGNLYAATYSFDSPKK